MLKRSMKGQSARLYWGDVLAQRFLGCCHQMFEYQLEELGVGVNEECLCALLPIAYLALLTGLSVQKGQSRLLLE